MPPGVDEPALDCDGLRRPRRLAGHDVVDLVGVDRLELEQRLGHRLDLVAVVLEQLARDRVLLVDDLADLAVDLAHRLLGHVLVRRDRAAEEDLALVLAVDHRAEHVGHAVARDHVARHLRRALEVVRGAGGHLVHEHLLGDAAAEQHRDDVQHVVAVHAVAVVLRQLHRHAQRAAARDDRDLVHRVGLGQQPRDDRVARLVVRGVAPLFLGHHDRAPLGAHDDLVLGHLEVVHVDQALAAARGEQRRLVDEVGEVGAGEARACRAR